MNSVAANLQRVQATIEAAAVRAGRDPSEVTLVAVSKTREPSEIAAAAAAGATEFGENYVQELLNKQKELGGIHWHFIGHLQRNKVRFILPFCAMVHVVDSVRLAQEIDHRARQLDRLQPVLLQVDLAGEETKFGCPENLVEELAQELANLPNVDWQGLMTIPPLAGEPEQSRPYFIRLRELRDRLRERFPDQPLAHLSMGMSMDYEVAIEEGATLVRIGTAIFGPRH
ncbi:MAG: YggS family pyridoxal phosphate-dependent enzyme [Armatimonadia bacterium]